MNNFEHEKHNGAREECDVEIIDLAEDTGGKPPRLAHRFLMWQRALNRGRVRWTLSLSMLFLAALVLLLTVHGSFLLPGASYKNSVVQSMALPLPANIKPALIILPQKEGLACLADMSWSLDSRYLAFVGYQKPCALVNDLYEPGRIALYDAATGQVVGLLRPDNSILPVLQEQFASIYGKQIISYHHILWSPLEQSLAITFTIDSLSATSPSRVDGLLLTSLDGKHVKVLLHAQNYTFSYTEWDVQKGKGIDTSGRPPFFYLLKGNVPSFAALKWATDGYLIPEKAQRYVFTPEKPLLGPIGNPDGDAAFTIWQPGQSGLQTQAGNRSPHRPGTYTWKTLFAAWSPDGRYLVDTIALDGKLDMLGLPGPAHQTPFNQHEDQAPLWNVRDTGLHHILQTSTGVLNGETLSWSLNGRLVAAYDSGRLDADLFDSFTGYRVASLLLPVGSGLHMSGNERLHQRSSLLHWSPDGTHVLLFDPLRGSAVIWNVG